MGCTVPIINWCCTDPHLCVLVYILFRIVIWMCKNILLWSSRSFLFIDYLLILLICWQIRTTKLDTENLLKFYIYGINYEWFLENSIFIFNLNKNIKLILKISKFFVLNKFNNYNYICKLNTNYYILVFFLRRGEKWLILKHLAKIDYIYLYNSRHE